MEVGETDEENNNTVHFLLHAYLLTSFDCISISNASEFFYIENKVACVSGIIFFQLNLIFSSDVTKALDAETEAKTEAGGFETEAEAQGSWTILFAVQSLSLIHIWRCRRSTLCRSRWSPYH